MRKPNPNRQQAETIAHAIALLSLHGETRTATYADLVKLWESITGRAWIAPARQQVEVYQ